MNLNHTNISPLIETQFPSFVREDGPMFVAFVKEYYKWMESTNNPLYHARRLLQYNDIDETLDGFLPHFQEKYLVNTPTNNITNQRELVKHSRELYHTKGTIESLRLIFNMLFGEEIDVYYPSDDILRPSDGVWKIPQYLEISISDRVNEFIGKDIIGSISGARAFVERVDRRTNKGSLVDVVFITNVRSNPSTGGGFIYGELISNDGVVANAPQITGSLTTINIIQAGAGFTAGQDLQIVSDRQGIEGHARVVSIGNRTGEVNYRLVDGGYGYTSNTSNTTTYGEFGTTDVIVSSNVLILQETVYTGAHALFERFETVTQPLARVTFSSSNTSIPAGALVYGINATANVISAGYAITSNQTGSNGVLVLSPHTISSMAIDSVFYANSVTGSFNVGELVYQSNGTGNVAVGMVSVANSTRIIVDEAVGPFQSNTVIRGSISGAGANVSSVNTYAYAPGTWTSTDIVSVILASTGNGGDADVLEDITATGTVVDANTTAVGVYNVSVNPFIPSQKSWVYATHSGGTIKSIVNAVSTGTPGGFKIGAIGDSEIVYLNTDFISGNNSSNLPYLGLTIDDASYGLPANTSAGYSSVIGTALAKQAIAIGTITSLTERNPGLNNTSRPFVIEYQKTIAGFGKTSRINCHLTDLAGGYALGEDVTQVVPINRATLTIANASSSFVSTTHELIKQTRADSVVVYGELYASSPTSISCYVANTANTFDSVSPIVGVFSGITANVTNANTGTLNSFARGTVESVFNNGADITIRRTSFQDFTIGETIYGAETGSTSTLADVMGVATSEVMGLDAVVDPIAGVFDGTISTVEVVDSGILYQDGETVELTFEGHQTPAYGVARIVTNGFSQGRYVGTKGTLDSDVKIQDNDYYQEYSYEIRSGVDRARYEDAVKSVTHVAGTKMFSKYVNSTLSSAPVTFAASAYDKVTTIPLTSVTGTFVVGEVVYQSNGTSNTATAVVLSYDTGLNTIQAVSTVGVFTPTQTAVGATSNASGTIANTNITLL